MRMWKGVSLALLIIILASTAYYLSSQTNQTPTPTITNPPQTDSTNPDPFNLADPPKIEPDKGLIQEIDSRKGHEIGYIANDNQKAIYVVDLTSEQYLGRIVFNAEEPRGGPSNIAVTPDSKYFIVTRSKFSNDILIIDTSTLELVKQIPGGKYNDYIVVNPTRNEAYILSGNYQDTNVYVLDLGSLSIVNTINLGRELGTADISPNGDTLYVTTSAGVSYIDLSKGEITKEAPMNTTYWKRVIANPTNDSIYVVNNPDLENMWPTIQVFNASNGEAIHTIDHLTAEKTWDGGITTMAATPDGHLLFSVSQMNELSIIDTSTYQIIRTISIPDYYGGSPSGIYFNAQGSKAYFIYWGGVAIDTPMPDTPSRIGVMDLTWFTFTNFIGLDDHAGAEPMVILR